MSNLSVQRVSFGITAPRCINSRRRAKCSMFWADPSMPKVSLVHLTNEVVFVSRVQLLNWTCDCSNQWAVLSWILLDIGSQNSFHRWGTPRSLEICRTPKATLLESWNAGRNSDHLLQGAAHKQWAFCSIFHRANKYNRLQRNEYITCDYVWFSIYGQTTKYCCLPINRKSHQTCQVKLTDLILDNRNHW